MELIWSIRLPKVMWQHAVNHAAYLSGFWSHSALKYMTPNELATGFMPDVSHLRQFGCTVYTPITPKPRSLTGPHRQLGIYIGCIGPSIILWLHPYTGSVFKARFVDCIFDETTFPTMTSSVPIDDGTKVSTKPGKRSRDDDHRTPKAKRPRKGKGTLGGDQTVENSGTKTTLGNGSNAEVVDSQAQANVRPEESPLAQDSQRGMPEIRSSQVGTSNGQGIQRGTPAIGISEKGESHERISQRGTSSDVPVAQKETDLVRILREIDAPQSQSREMSNDSPQGVKEVLSTVEIHQEVPEDKAAEKEAEKEKLRELYQHLVAFIEPVTGAREVPSFDEVYLMVDNMISDDEIPKSVEEAMNSPHAEEWKKAMQDELNALNRRKVFKGPMKVSVVDLITLRLLIVFSLHYGLEVPEGIAISDELKKQNPDQSRFYQSTYESLCLRKTKRE